MIVLHWILALAEAWGLVLLACAMMGLCGVVWLPFHAAGLVVRRARKGGE